MGEEFYFVTITTKDCSLWDWKRGRNEEWIKEKEQRTLDALENLSSKSEAEINRIFDGFINEALEMNDEAFRIDEAEWAKEINGVLADPNTTCSSGAKYGLRR
jgi:hypothetical protein